MEYAEGKVYRMNTGSGSFEVVCNRVFGTGAVSFFRYKKAGAKTPIARYRMNPDGTIVDNPDATISVPTTATKTQPTQSKSRSSKGSLEKNKPLLKLVIQAWKDNKPAGYYSGLAKVSDSCYVDLMTIYYLKRTLEGLDRYDTQTTEEVPA